MEHTTENYFRDGLIHRDLTGNNVLMIGTRAKITDWYFLLMLTYTGRLVLCLYLECIHDRRWWFVIHDGGLLYMSLYYDHFLPLATCFI